MNKVDSGSPWKDRSFHGFLDRYAFFLLTLAFVLVRAYQYPAHPFNISALYKMHALDIEVLEHDLVNGLLHLHSQPPLFNLVLGVGLKTMPVNAFPTVFGTLFFLLGLGSLILTYALMKELRVAMALRMVVCFLYLFHEPLLSAERYLSYIKPITFFVLLSIHAAARYLQSRSPAWLHVSLLSLVLVVMLRSFFHAVVWMFPLTAFLLYLTARHESRFPTGKAAVCGFYLLVAVAPSLNNYFQMGSFTTSSWFGMNLAATTAYIAPGEIDRLIEAGEVSPVMKIPRFSPAEVYLAYYADQGRHPQGGSMALDAPVKTTGKPNFNHLVYAWASKEYLQGALYLIPRYPLEYLKSVLTEINIAFSQSPGRLFTPNSPWRPAFDKALESPLSREFLSIFFFPVLLFLVYCAVAILQMVGTWKRLHTKNPVPETLPQAAILGMSAFNMVYVLAVLSLFELGEGCFMRGPIDPLIAAGTAVVLQSCVQHGGVGRNPLSGGRSQGGHKGLPDAATR